MEASKRQAIYSLIWALGFGALILQAINALGSGNAHLYIAKIAVYTLAIVLLFVRKVPQQENRSWLAVVVTGLHCFLPFLFTADRMLILPGQSIVLMVAVAGLAVSGFGLLSLWESFGIIPANRGVQSQGLYRVIRHPIYAGYIIMSLAWCWYAPSYVNIGILFCYFGLTLWRTSMEEHLLSADASYCDYRKKVPFRIVPGVI